MAVFLRVLALHPDRQPQDHGTHEADQQVHGMKAEPHPGKSGGEPIPDRKYLCGEVCTWSQPERLGQLAKGVHEQEVGQVQ